MAAPTVHRVVIRTLAFEVIIGAVLDGIASLLDGGEVESRYNTYPEDEGEGDILQISLVNPGVCGGGSDVAVQEDAAKLDQEGDHTARVYQQPWPLHAAKLAEVLGGLAGRGLCVLTWEGLASALHANIVQTSSRNLGFIEKYKTNNINKRYFVTLIADPRLQSKGKLDIRQRTLSAGTMS